MTCFGCRRTLRLAGALIVLAAWLPGCQDRDDQPTVDREAAGTTGGQPHDTSGMTAGSRVTLGATTPPTTHQTTDSTPPDTVAPDTGRRQAPPPPRRTAPAPRPQRDSAVPAPTAADSAPQPATDTATPPPADTQPRDTGTAAAAPRDPYHPEPRDTVGEVIYTGWKQFNLNCARCHGEDVQGTTIAPHLVQSLKNGSIQSKEQFIEVVCSGRPEKGMPAWCPLGLDLPTIEAIYEYVKARSEGRMHPGRPARRET